MLFRNERADVDSVVSFTPRDVPTSPEHAKYWKDWDLLRDRFYTERPGGWNQTKRQELHMLAFQGRSYFGRKDVLVRSELVLCGSCGHKTKTIQYTVDFAREGSLVGDISMFSEEDITWAKTESQRCWKIALADPIIMKMWFGD